MQDYYLNIIFECRKNPAYEWTYCENLQEYLSGIAVAPGWYVNPININILGEFELAKKLAAMRYKTLTYEKTGGFLPTDGAKVFYPLYRMASEYIGNEQQEINKKLRLARNELNRLYKNKKIGYFYKGDDFLNNPIKYRMAVKRAYNGDLGDIWFFTLYLQDLNFFIETQYESYCGYIPFNEYRIRKLIAPDTLTDINKYYEIKYKLKEKELESFPLNLGLSFNSNYEDEDSTVITTEMADRLIRTPFCIYKKRFFTMNGLLVKLNFSPASIFRYKHDTFMRTIYALMTNLCANYGEENVRMICGAHSYDINKS